MTLFTHLVRGERAERLLLLLHGFGADELDLPGVLPYLDPDGTFLAVSPRAPIASPPGFSWFDISGAPNPETGQLMGFADSLDELRSLFDAACTEHGMAPNEAIVAGFSQGGSMALALALGAGSGPRPAGLLAMSSFLPPGIDLDETAIRTVPMLVQHGSQDPLVPVERGRALAKALQGAGGHVVYREYPMQHQIAAESMGDAKAWLEDVLSGMTPSEPIAEPQDEGPVKSVTTATFDAEVLASEVPVIVDFWAPWCGPCRQVSPIVEQIAAMREGAYRVVKVNIDEEPALAQRYNVQSIPLIGLFRNGRLERQSLGAKPRPQLEAELGMLVIP